MRAPRKRAMDQEYYRLTDEQILLIRQLNINHDDGSALGYEGGAYVDTKRPFGNSNVPYDVFEIIDPRTEKEVSESFDTEDDDEYEKYAEIQQQAYDRLYSTLSRALQVVLSSGSFEPGIYATNKYCSSYELVTDENEIFKADLILGDKHDDPRYDRF